MPVPAGTRGVGAPEKYVFVEPGGVGVCCEWAANSDYEEFMRRGCAGEARVLPLLLNRRGEPRREVQDLAAGQRPGGPHRAVPRERVREQREARVLVQPPEVRAAEGLVGRLGRQAPHAGPARVRWARCVCHRWATSQNGAA